MKEPTDTSQMDIIALKRLVDELQKENKTLKSQAKEKTSLQRQIARQSEEMLQLEQKNIIHKEDKKEMALDLWQAHREIENAAARSKVDENEIQILKEQLEDAES